jgi:Xaa-Pro aminopeptidase
METVDTSGRLSVLRTLMKERKIDVYGTYSSKQST